MKMKFIKICGANLYLVGHLAGARRAGVCPTLKENAPTDCKSSFLEPASGTFSKMIAHLLSVQI
jgi:hypothetical protein